MKFLKFLASALLISALYSASVFLFTEYGHIWYMFSTMLTAALLSMFGFAINYFWTWGGQRAASAPRATWRFIKYIIVGGSTTLLGWTLVYLFTEYAHLWYMASAGVGKVIVFTVAFLANNYWTWGTGEDREVRWLGTLLRWLGIAKAGETAGTKKVFIIGYYGYKNIGDDAMLLSLLGLLRLCGDNGRYCDLDYYYRGDPPLDTIKKVLRADVVVLGGGTHMRNWGKGWFVKSARIIALGVLVRLLGKRFHMLNIGIEGRIWEWASKLVANVITIRHHDTFDLSAALEFKRQRRGRVLGVSLTPVNGIYHGDFAKDWALVSQIVSNIRKWLSVHHGWRVKFFSFNGNGKYGDNVLNERAAAFISGAQYVEWQPDIFKTIEEMSGCGAFIGMRYHSCVFAYMSGTPLIVVETYPRCGELAQFVGVNALGMEQILSGDFELNFDRAKFPVKLARKLAVKGIVV